MDKQHIILDDIQELAKAELLKKFRYCLFWDVGVGKTYPVLSRLEAFEDRKKILILAPAVAIKNMWQGLADTDSFGVFSKHDVELRSYEWLAWQRTTYVPIPNTERLRKVVEENRFKINHRRYDVIILDEAHRMSTSGRSSKTSRFVQTLTSTATYVYGLTGTPARNGYHELYYLFKNLNIQVWNQWTYPAFLDYYFRGFIIKLPQGDIFKPLDFKHKGLQDTFLHEINPYCMFASKTRSYTVDFIEVPIKSHKIPEYYKALKGIYNDLAGTTQQTLPLVGFTRAYMILNGFQYNLDLTGANIAQDFFPNPKLDEIVPIIRDEFTKFSKNVIVYYNFQHDYKKLSERLDREGIIHTNDINQAKTMTGDFVVLLQLKRGISVNLQEVANALVFYTYNFSYVDFDQCIGRIDRRGQEDDIRIYLMYYINSIEKSVILKALMNKKSVDHTLKSKAGVNVIRKELEEYE